MSSATAGWTVPLKCPECRQQRGFPIGLTIENRNTVVAVIRCQECEHMWQLQRRPGEAWPVRIAADRN